MNHMNIEAILESGLFFEEEGIFLAEGAVLVEARAVLLVEAVDYLSQQHCI